MPTDTLLSRFLRYVQIHTTSNPDSETTPSSPQQWDLLRLLRDELEALGAQEVRLNEHGYLFATLPATTDKHVPTLAFAAHVDTTPDFPGQGVKPLVHRNYNGQPIVLPDDPSQVLDPARDPNLKTALGKDIVTASGATLLGADDKAGVAIVMTLAAHLLAHPEIKHGRIRLCFNPDEEIGRGVARLDLKELGADVAYTLDGEHLGEINWETFSGDSATVTIEGVATHPGWARSHGMVNAVQLAARLLAALPREHLAPETTDGRQGYIHPHDIKGNAARVTLSFILRDFDNDKLAQHGARLKALCEGLQGAEPRARITCEIKPSYRNMGYWLKNDRRPVDYAFEAVRAAGLQPRERAIRGGTDGSRLTERGLPTPNIFNGCHNAHSPLEWVCMQDMEAAVQVCVKLAEIWEQRS